MIIEGVMLAVLEVLIIGLVAHIAVCSVGSDQGGSDQGGEVESVARGAAGSRAARRQLAVARSMDSCGRKVGSVRRPRRRRASHHMDP